MKTILKSTKSIPANKQQQNEQKTHTQTSNRTVPRNTTTKQNESQPQYWQLIGQSAEKQKPS